MTKSKKIQEKIEITLNYSIGKQDIENGVFVGGIEKPKYLDELVIDVCEHEIFDDIIDDFIDSGKHQVNLRGSSRALEELGKYMIALSRYNTVDPDYHDHLDVVRNSKGDAAVYLNIRKRK